MTLTQKVLAHHARGLTRPWVQAGDIVRLRVDWTIASELAWNGMDRTYSALGRPPLHDPGRFFLAVDHTVDPVALANDPKARALAQRSRDFAREARVRHFHDANETILHTRFYRELVQPGQVVIGADSHTTSHGGLGAFAIGLGGADVTAAMVLGETWLEVPEAIAVEYSGTPAFGIGGKDIILHTLERLGRNTSALERTVEFRGEAVRGFSTDTRFTLANMTAELGGLNGIFEADAVTLAWLAGRKSEKDAALCFRADEGAPYVERHRLELDRLSPRVAKPFSPDNVRSVEEAAGLPLHGCFIGACTTTEEELVLAALVLEAAFRERAPRPAVRERLVVPGDLAIIERMRQGGLWAHYERAGFRIGPPGCSMCLGVASERARPGEVWLSSQNRNYENRMGQGSLAWLASAATVAASSVDMRITDPRPWLERIDRERYARLLFRDRTPRVPEVAVREPEVEGTFIPPAVASAPPGGVPAGSEVEGTFIPPAMLTEASGPVPAGSRSAVEGTFVPLTQAASGPVPAGASSAAEGAFIPPTQVAASGPAPAAPRSVVEGTFVPRHPASEAVSSMGPLAVDGTGADGREASVRASHGGTVIRAQVQRFGDHVDTDAIIPGEFCHLTDSAALGARCFAHVRPDFAARAREGRTVIVAGEGWGTGSSREQAVWALQGAGIRAVIAKSFAFIHRRNLVNEAVPHLVLTDPDFHALVQEGDTVEVDPGTATVTLVSSGRRFAAAPVSPLVHALQSEGGLVPAVRRLGRNVFEVLPA
ncbi:aconitase family protein [Pyxidicoccus fallax]|uniref:LeuD/DmdB family oxidoreductase small subunit n=1 Tax=Pyxidicoccus fallax TaxID=394095 RepID=UPI001FE592CB|nr:aconitase family protein [Pyxidicoccus fallax]